MEAYIAASFLAAVCTCTFCLIFKMYTLAQNSEQLQFEQEDEQANLADSYAPPHIEEEQLRG